MLTRMVVQFATVLVIGICSAGVSSALSVSGPGLDTGGACPQGGACAPAGYDFDVTPAPATGTIDFTFNGVISWTVDINMQVATLTMEDTAGAIDGVDKIVFSNLVFDVDNWSAIQSGGTIGGLNTTGFVQGTYEQFLGNTSVGGPANFGAVSVGYGSLNCDDSLTGQCGFTMGFDAPELNLNVGTSGVSEPYGAPYEFVWTFNVIVPEPSTASLLALGLVGVAALRRRRA
jgi:hypothetical protein